MDDLESWRVDLKITIKDIAQMAGVSMSTVSRVMNNSKPVNDDVRKRVLEAIEQTQFRPNAIARSLAKSESRLLGVMIPEFKNTVLDDLIIGINQVSKLYGYNSILGLTGGLLENELHYMNLFREVQAEGIIIASAFLKAELIEIIKMSKIPCILIGRDSNETMIPSVHVDNVTASYEAVTYLLQQGHRKIAMLHIEGNDISGGDHRLQGYRQAMADAGIPLREDWMMQSGISVEDGMRSMRMIHENSPMPTAVFCATDRMAIGAMNYLMEADLRVPDDVSVFGFDGIDMSSIVRPKLSTVKYSAAEIGMTAARNLIKQIRGEKVSPLIWTVSHQLEIRDSVRSI